MFVDPESFLAILSKAPVSAQLVKAMESTAQNYTSGSVRLETVTQLAMKWEVPIAEVQAAFDQLIDVTNVKVVAVTDSTARKAAEAFMRFSKPAGHAAQLSYGDCLVYASAKEYRLPLLSPSRRFTQTDIRLAELPEID